ncbi:MAG: 16S rRNA (cytosine(967)-C(5))-methyltransferase RsmB [Cocleimonas sp.]|nr:16S rRNA (cytosine(967)-C(5))-methyltransferase RsmB [Cocleimonas sp.]
MKLNNPRLIATKILRRVIYQGESLSALLIDREATDPLVRDLCFGSLRWHERLSAVLNELMSKPLKNKDKDVECLLRIGLYQIIYQQTPDHAAVNETVSTLKGLKKPWAKKLVNGILRNFLRQKDELLPKIDQKDAIRYAFPDWLMGKIKKAWPDHWQQILTASNQRAPMVLRVNLLHQTQEGYCNKLNQNGIKATASSVCNTAIILDQPINVHELPAFDQGEVSVQDTAAQLAAEILDLKPNMQVLDACAAPGGKTGHILENCQPLDVIAVDNSATRLQRVEDNLQRLFPKPNGIKRHIKLLAVDAGDTEQWAKEMSFDRILLDAPCSATGVIRRHPDIKCLRRADDIKGLQQQQWQLLTALWGKLKPDGKLLYATCSILPEENEKQIATFIEQTEDAVIQTIKVKWGHALHYGRQIFPGESAMDGFYYALIKKKL